MADPSAATTQLGWEVRFHLSDLDPDRYHFSAEQISFALSEKGNEPRLAAAMLARQRAMGQMTTTGGAIKIGDFSQAGGGSNSDIAQQYLDLADRLEAEARMGQAVQISAGGIYQADTDSLRSNPALRQPRFEVGMDDNPRTGGASYPPEWFRGS